MALQISWLAVGAAVMVGMVIAWVWYSDWGLVGSTWRGLTGVTKADSVRAGKAPFVVLIAAIIVTALTLAITSSAASVVMGSDSFAVALLVAFLAWLGFSLTTLAQHNGFEQKPKRLTAINSAYQLVLFLGMGLVIGLLE